MGRENSVLVISTNWGGVSNRLKLEPTVVCINQPIVAPLQALVSLAVKRR